MSTEKPTPEPLTPKQMEGLRQNQEEELQAQMRTYKKVLHGVCGEAVGGISETLTEVLNRVGSTMLGLQEKNNTQAVEIVTLKMKLNQVQAELRKLQPEPEPKEETPVKP